MNCLVNPTSYTRDAGLAVARFLAEGGSLRRAASLLPRAYQQLGRWARLPDEPEFRKLVALARLAAGGDAEATQALYAPPAQRSELLGALLEHMPDRPDEIDAWVGDRLGPESRLR